MLGRMDSRLKSGSLVGTRMKVFRPRVTVSRRSLLALPNLLLTARNSNRFVSDGRLQSEADRSAFLRWFTFLAEAQYFVAPTQRPPAIVDCSSLLRYAYREALRWHDSAWAAQAHLPLIPAIPSVAQYNYPRTPTGPKLFRVGRQMYSEFANAETLYRYNATLISRDFLSSRPGDLLFYHHSARAMPFHSIIVLGPSQITRTSDRFVVYDTGPDGTTEGEIKRLSFEELLHFPDGQWRPISRNPAFLGVFRWNIVSPSP